MQRRGILFCLVGPAGSGKTSHGEELLKQFKDSLKYSISVTTRSPRGEERDGVHYHFVSKDEFQKRIDAGLFFEWEEVHGNRYGTLKKTVEDSIQSGVDLLLDIDIKGALNFKRSYSSDTVIVFMVPPSIDELKSRVLKRGSVTQEELVKRLKTAAAEYSVLLGTSGKNSQVDYFVVNDDRSETFKKVVAILLAERHKLERQDTASIKEICRVDG